MAKLVTVRAPLRVVKVGGVFAVELLEGGLPDVSVRRVESEVVLAEEEHCTDSIEMVVLGGQFAGLVDAEVGSENVSMFEQYY